MDNKQSARVVPMLLPDPATQFPIALPTCHNTKSHWSTSQTAAGDEMSDFRTPLPDHRRWRSLQYWTIAFSTEPISVAIRTENSFSTTISSAERIRHGLSYNYPFFSSNVRGHLHSQPLRFTSHRLSSFTRIFPCSCLAVRTYTFPSVTRNQISRNILSTRAAIVEIIRSSPTRHPPREQHHVLARKRGKLT